MRQGLLEKFRAIDQANRRPIEIKEEAVKEIQAIHLEKHPPLNLEGDALSIYEFYVTYLDLKNRVKEVAERYGFFTKD